MSAVLHAAATAPAWALGGPPLILTVALGLAVHKHRTRKAHL